MTVLSAINAADLPADALCWILLCRRCNNCPFLCLTVISEFTWTHRLQMGEAIMIIITFRYKITKLLQEQVNNKHLYNLTFIIITNRMQLYRLIYFSLPALHVSGDVLAHHQEHLTVFTLSGIIDPGCCRLVSWMNWNWNMWVVRHVYNSSKRTVGNNQGEYYQMM
jgi:uncharacterized protein involved in tolerance to divalent cations